MKRAVLKIAAVAAMTAGAVLGGASAASADPVEFPGGTIPSPIFFSGMGTGPTADAAFEAGLADAQQQADAAGLTNCVVDGDPTIFGAVAPGFPLFYVALVTLACTP